MIVDSVRTAGMRKPFLARALATLFSFEAVFAAFLNAGHYKAARSLAWVPVDLTALTFGLSILAAMWVVRGRGVRLPRAGVPILAFGAAYLLFVLTSLIWTPSSVYGPSKALFSATLTLWALVGPVLVISGDARRALRFALWLFVFALWLGVDAFVTSASNPQGNFVNVLGSNYLGVGRTIGIGSAIVLAIALAPRTKPLWRVLAASLFAVSLWLLLVVGGRGPLIAVGVASLVPLVLGVGAARGGGWVLRRYVPWLLAFVLLAAAGVAALAARPDPPPTLRRLEVLWNSSMGGTSAATRAYWWKQAPALWEQRPIAGHGVGSWPILMGFADRRSYPHDIFLETLVEEGALGLVLLLAMLAAALAALAPWRSIATDPWRLLLLMVLVNALVNAMVSGDVSDNRFLFAAAGFAAFGARRDS